MITLLLVGFLLTPALSFANEDEENDESREYGKGDLHIQTQTIQDGQVVHHDHYRPIGYEIAPFIFLEDKMEIEAQRVERNAEFIISTRERLFLEEAPKIGFDTSELIDRLFIEEEEFGHRSGSVGIKEHYFHVPIWVIVIGIVISSGFLGYVAVILGQRLGHVIYKNEEGEEVSG